jgi:ubiquitin-protein ligase
MNAINYPEGLNPEIVEELQYLNGVTGIKKRLARELFDLQNNKAYIHIEYNDNNIISRNIYNNPYIFNIHVVLAGENDLITFEICRDYPFKPPKNIKINYKQYSSFLKINSSNTMKQVKELYAKFYKTRMPDCCLSCSSISCYANWSPPVKLINIVQEVQTFKKIRRSVIDKLLATKIINKYLIDDKGFHEYFYSFLFHF